MTCETCEYAFPALHPNNIEAWALWSLIGTQWRDGYSGIIGLDYPAVFKVAEVMGFEMEPATFLKIRTLEHLQLEKAHAPRAKGGTA